MSFPLEPLWLNWFLMALGLICLDLLLGSGYLFRLGAAALFTALAAWLLGDSLWPLPFAMFAVLVVLGQRLGPKPGSKRRRSAAACRSGGQGAQVGRQARLTESLRGGHGMLCLDGTDYQVRGPELPAGTEVVVLEQAGDSLLVERADRV